MTTRRPLRPIHEQGILVSPNRRNKLDGLRDVLDTYICLGFLIAIWPVAKVIGWITGEKQ
jgi:hypothetical protein